MIKEYEALMKSQTWSLVSPPSNSKVIGCKWVFSIKRHPNGTIHKYKARLIAKRFHQREGLHFDQGFSLVIKPLTVKLILILAFSKGWRIRQFDFYNTFLNVELIEDVLMTQPEGFVQGETTCVQAPKGYLWPKKGSKGLVFTTYYYS